MAGIALAALVGLAGGDRPAWGDVPVFTKTCVDLNGGSLCADDWVRCTLHVEVTVQTETFTIFDFIRGSFFTLWRQVPPTPPPPASNGSTLENQAMTPAQSGRYQWNNVTLTAGSSFDFVYEAQVRTVPWGTTACQAATLRFPNLDQISSNEHCETFDCVLPGVANTQVSKTWTGPGPVVGDPVTFTLALANFGGVADQTVRLTDALDPARFTPPSFAFSRPPDSGGGSGHTLDATWNTLDAGETITVTIDAVFADCDPTSSTNLCNQATITSQSITGNRLSDDPGTPRVYGDGTCRTVTPGGSPALVQPAAKTMVDVDGPPVRLGDTVHVTVTFDNRSPCIASGGHFEDTIPVDLDYVAGSATLSPSSGTITYDAPTRNLIVDGFSAGDGYTILSFDTTIASLPASQRICNTGHYSFNGPTIDTTTACLDTVIDQIELAKSHTDPNGNGSIYNGQVMRWTVAVTNVGTTDIAALTVGDTIPACFDVVGVVDAAGGSVSINGQDVVVSGIPLPRSPGTVQVVIEVRANGNCIDASQWCNVAVGQTPRTLAPVASPDSCITVRNDALRVGKAVSNPNGDGSVGRGQHLLYSVTLSHQGGPDVTDAAVNDSIPSCFDVVQVVDAAGGQASVNGRDVSVTGISLPAGSGPLQVVIEVVENGSCADDLETCNQAVVGWPGATFVHNTNPACIRVRPLNPGCSQPPGPVALLRGVKATPAARFSWGPEAASLGGYRLYAVGDKTLIGQADGAAGLTPECQTTGQPAITCDDPDALDAAAPARLYYQVMGVCADGSEGAH